MAEERRSVRVHDEVAKAHQQQTSGEVDHDPERQNHRSAIW